MDMDMGQNCRRSRIAIYLAGTAFLTFSGTGAWAQDAASEASKAPQTQKADGTAKKAAKPDDGALAEIIITAQKRAEDVQQVPIAVNVVSGQTLQQQNLTSLEELTETMPGVKASDGLQSNSLMIRGVGSGAHPLLDQSVGQFVDGVYRGRSRTSDALFFDFDRIELLKGPQSVYFGNNATAGAISYITRRPGRDFEATGRALYGMYGQYALEGAVGGPLSDQVGIRVAATFNGIKDGWVTNVVTGKGAPRERNIGGRVTLTYRPSEKFNFTLKGEAGQHDTFGGWTSLPFRWARCPEPAPLSPTACAVVAAQDVPVGLDQDKIAELPGQMMRLKNYEGVLTANYYAGDHTLTSITAFSYYNYKAHMDIEHYRQTDVYTASFPENYRQFSQEVRLVSPSGGPIEYIIGGYYQRDKLKAGYQINFDIFDRIVPLIPPFAPLIPYLTLANKATNFQDEDLWSVFGSLSWRATERLKLTAGLRQSWVRKKSGGDIFYGHATDEFDGFERIPANVEPLLGALFGVQGKGNVYTRKDNGFMPSANIQYKLNPNARFYASYNRTFKAGGINSYNPLSPLEDNTFEPEHANAYEVGFKSKLFNNRLLFNIDAFYTDYRNLQGIAAVVDLTDPASQKTPVLVNAASSVTKGVELELQGKVSRALTLGANIAYVDSYYKRFTEASLTTLETFCKNPTNRANNPGACASIPNPVPRARDRSGEPTGWPKWNGNVYGTYVADLKGGSSLAFNLGAYFTSTPPKTDDVYLPPKGYVRFDGRITYELADRRWAFDVIFKNINDVKGVSPNAVLVIPQYPRSVAGQVRFNF